LYLHRSLFLSFSFKKYSGRGKDGHPKRSPSHRSTSSSPSRAAPAARKCYTRTYVFSVQIWEMWNCVSSMIFGAAMVTQHPSPILNSWCSPIPSLYFRTLFLSSIGDNSSRFTKIQVSPLTSTSPSSNSHEAMNFVD
jgi:hypothetical protein